jgi:ATP-dependent DNA helicase PIF1
MVWKPQNCESQRVFLCQRLTSISFPRREDVDRSNTTRMARLSSPPNTFDAMDGGSITDPQQRDKMLANFMAPARLVLRKDAQVMLIKNYDDLLVNGSMGRVVDFVDPTVHREQGGDDTLGSGKDGKKPTASIGKPYPLVEFLLPNGSKKQSLVVPDIWKVELPNGEVQVSRIQVGCPSS